MRSLSLLGRMHGCFASNIILPQRARLHRLGEAVCFIDQLAAALHYSGSWRGFYLPFGGSWRGACDLKRNLAGERVPPHFPVALVAEPGVFEGGGLVVLEEEVAHPGKGVALHEGGGDEPPGLGDEGDGHQQQAEAGADEVQAAAGAVGVLAEVVGVEILEGLVVGGLGLGGLLGTGCSLRCWGWGGNGKCGVVMCRDEPFRAEGSRQQLGVAQTARTPPSASLPPPLRAGEAKKRGLTARRVLACR